MKASILTFLLFFSCTKYASLTRDAMGTHIQDAHMDLSHLSDVEWAVGKNKEHKITQSFTFIMNLPRLKSDDLDYLTSQKGIDAWIIRVIQIKGSEKQDLGSFYTLFKPRKLSRGISSGAATSASVKIYYAASYASERFRSFRCPAFSHNKKIQQMDIYGEDTPLNLNVDVAYAYPEKSQLIELTPSSFNGGNSLQGEYHLEIAPYNSNTKMIHSSFKRLPRHIIVNSEESVNIPSCAGVHPEIE